MICQLDIEAGLSQGLTYLQKCYVTTPLKVANITEDKSLNRLELMLMSSSPGVLDGDQYDINILVEKGSSLHLSTQSYQRLFTMKEGASQQMKVVVEPGASFTYLPHPCVPHKDAIYTANNQIFLAENATLIWGEVLTSGRKLHGESFLFSSYQNKTAIYKNGRLKVKENVCIKPDKNIINNIGQLEGFSHQATLIFICESSDIKQLISTLHSHLSGMANISFGVTSLQINGLMVRLLGHKGEQLFETMKHIATIVSAKNNALK